MDKVQGSSKIFGERREQRISKMNCACQMIVKKQIKEACPWEKSGMKKERAIWWMAEGIGKEEERQKVIQFKMDNLCKEESYIIRGQNWIK